MAVFLIVGGGVAGLSAGIFAEQAGHHAIVAERGASAGGNLTGWRRGAYTVDNCVHWLIGTREGSADRRLWEDVGILDGEGVRSLPLLYTVEGGGESLSLFRDFGKTERAMLALSPEDREETLHFCRAVRALMRFSGLSRDTSLAAAVRAVPSLARYAFLSAGALADRFSHPLLRRFMTGLVGRDFTSLALLYTAANFSSGNADLPAGGSLAAAERMAERFVSLGGELRTKSEVAKILTSGREAFGVRLADGEEVPADAVILAADPAALFGKVLDAPLPPALLSLYKNPAMHRFSSVGCAFAVPRAALPFSGDLVLQIGRRGESHEVGDGRLVLREFSHEPSFAPEGETVITTMRFCYEDGCRHFLELSKNADAYRKEKERLLAETEGDIVDRFPTLSGKLRPLDIWTPATYRRFTGAPLGTYMSFVLPPARLPRVPARVPGFRNLYLATQWQSPPGGLPTALHLGRRAAELACRAYAAPEKQGTPRRKASEM